MKHKAAISILFIVLVLAGCVGSEQVEPEREEIPEEAAEIAETQEPQRVEPQSEEERSDDITWQTAFRNKALPEGYVTADSIAFYAVGEDDSVTITNVPKEEVYAYNEEAGTLPRTRYFEQYIPENLATLLPALDYAVAHSYCRFSIPTTEFTGSDILSAAKYLALTYCINDAGIQSITATSRETENGEKLNYVLVALAGMDWRGMNKYREAMDKAREIVASVPEGCGEYETALYLYSYLTRNVRYNYDDYYSETDWNFLYDALVLKSTVCAGYAEALYYLYNLAGIECFTIKGYIYIPGGESNYHIWNVAKIDGVYYQFDATWDAGLPAFLYRFFGVSSEDIQSYYPRNITAFSLEYCPECTEAL